MGLSLREPISTASPSRKMIDRKPSHFGSKLSAPSGMRGTALASIGATGGITGRFKLVISHPEDNAGSLEGPFLFEEHAALRSLRRYPKSENHNNPDNGVVKSTMTQLIELSDHAGPIDGGALAPTAPDEAAELLDAYSRAV